MANRDPDQRHSIREYYASDSRRSSSSDVFSDIHALDSPESTAPRILSGAADPSTAPVREPSAALRPSSSRPSLQPRWSSIRKSNSSQQTVKRGSLSSRHDGYTPASAYLPGASSEHETSTLASVPRRVTSNASSVFIPRTQSPYQGAAGPSHPYAMYHQDIGVSRTPSNATSSTTRTPLRPYVGSSGPTHPYGLYAENIVSEDETTPRAESNPAVPLGFTEASNGYQRRLGPEGDDADDFVGPDGHTEQLPAYTRYPNDLPPKIAPIEPVVNTNPPLDPFADSQTTLNATPIEHADHSANSPMVAPHTVDLIPSNTSGSADEGGHFKEVAPTGRKKRVCKIIPLWLLTVAIVVLAAIVVGCIVGVAVRGHHHAHENKSPAPAEAQSSSSPSATVTLSTYLMDATPISTSANLLPAPTGAFVLPMRNTSSPKTNCLSDKKVAWNCAKVLMINFVLSPTTGKLPQAQILPDPHASSVLRYGPQPPQMSKPANMRLVYDKDDTDKGPAYFFQQLYDKVIIVKESDLSNTDTRRWLDDTSGGSEDSELEERHRGPRSPVSPNDSPWFCYWNNTVVEGFIYIDHDSNSVAQSTVLSSTAPQDTGDPDASSMMHRRRATGVSGTAFPKLVKLEELRGPRRMNPYCQQMQMSINLEPSLLTKPDGSLIQIDLDDDEPLQINRVDRPEGSQRNGDSVKRGPRQNMLSSCACEWLSQ